MNSSTTVVQTHPPGTVARHFPIDEAVEIHHSADVRQEVLDSTLIDLSNSLKGKTIHVPNIGTFFEGWPTGQINTAYPLLGPVVDAKIDSLGLDRSKRKRVQYADLALFVCSCWPRAEYETCITLVYFMIWVFLWDDEIDLVENLVAHDFSAARVFRQQTLAFITYSLGFGERRKGEPVSPNVVISSFREVGQRLCISFNEGQRQRFLDDLVFYIEMTQAEQNTKLCGTLPTVAEYWVTRMGSSAVRPFMIMAELSIGVELPDYLRELADMSVLWDETTIIISLTNDILSLKKELRSDSVISVVPLSVNAGLELQPAVDEALNALRRSIQRLSKAAERILLEVPEGSADRVLVVDYLSTVKANSTGHHYWSVRTERYLPAGSMHADGSAAIEL